MPVVPQGYSIFVVDLHYVATPDRIEAALADHIEFVKANFASGTFIASGRKASGAGGVILAVAEKSVQLEAILRDDPFQQLELAEFKVTEFIPAMVAAGLEQ